MDGLTFLRKIMEQHPVPVVICSSLAEEGSDVLFRAMEYGAVEIIQKPKLATKSFLEESKIRLTGNRMAAARRGPTSSPASAKRWPVNSSGGRRFRFPPCRRSSGPRKRW